MTGTFPPPLGSQIAGRFQLLAPLRGDGAVLTFLAHDLQTGQRRALTLFDPARVQADVWAEYARLVVTAAEAKIPGLALPAHVPATPPEPPHVVDDPPANRGLDRLRAQEGRIPWQRALAIGERLAGVLYGVYAATGVAHRALTPSRCTVDVADEVEVLDYGAAEVELAAEQAEEDEYRAPEQRAGKGDHRSDVFSLAAILYELISGTSPSDTPLPSLSSLVSVSPAVTRLLEQSLAPDPTQRPADLATMRAALRELLGLAQLPPGRQEAPASPPPTTPRGAPNKPRADGPSLRQLDPLPIIPSAKPSSPASASPVLATQAAFMARAELPSDEPPIERTERLPPSPAHQDTTLVLSNSTESPTERLPPISAHQDTTLVLSNSTESPTERLPAISPARRPRPDDPLTERTEVFNRLPDHRVAREEQTEKLSGTGPLPERTEILSTPPARGHSPQPDRTEVLGALLADPRLGAVPRRSPRSMVSDEDRTIVMSRSDRGPVQTWPTSMTPLTPTKGTLDGAELERPRRDQELKSGQPSPPTPKSSPHPMPTLERSQRATLIAANVVLALTLLVGLFIWALS